MLEPLKALEDGATVLTATSRLARHLRFRFHARQRDAGRLSWPSPKVLQWREFIQRLWTEWLPASRMAPLLLNASQRAAAWEQVIPAAGEDSLLDIHAAALRAAEAWTLIVDYDLPVRDGRFQAHEDCEAFLGWARQYEQLCKDKRWLDGARLPDFVSDKIAAGEIEIPAPILYTGFDELTPLQKILFHETLKAKPAVAESREAKIERFQLPDAAAEAEAAARWAREKLERDPTASVGIVVPDLAARRGMIGRIFRDVLDPCPFSSAAPAFHISAGAPLASTPVVHAALSILELCGENVPIENVGMLLRSPWIEGAREEASARAMLDAKLRRLGKLTLSIGELKVDADGCPIWKRLVSAVEALRRQFAPRQRPGDWSESLSGVLAAAGWARGSALDSGPYQAAEAWNELLREFASLDVAVNAVSLSSALKTLKRMAERKEFQSQNTGEPVQVMGALEAAGVDFDSLWVTGLHDGAFPAPCRPHPFLPLSMQRDHRLPHSTPARELEFARLVLGRLQTAAPCVTLSYPRREGDRSLRPTPLIDGPWDERKRDGLPVAPAAMEAIDDSHAPPLSGSKEHKGGAALFKDIAACPFRAFARHRLHANGLDEAELGIRATDRGSAVHLALDSFWRETKSHANLVKLSSDELDERIARCAEDALDKRRDDLTHKIEERRLKKLLKDWLEIEKLREPFSVLSLEQKRSAGVGGLNVSLRADRIDQLPDGRKILFDYKTGEVDKNSWKRDRPTDPQLPLYCVTEAEPFAGVAFAQLRANDLTFIGTGVPLPEMAEINLETGGLGTEIPLWRTRLEALAKSFLDGDARVDPLKDACEYCDVKPLCRIHERGPKDEPEGDDDAAE